MSPLLYSAQNYLDYLWTPLFLTVPNNKGKAGFCHREIDRNHKPFVPCFKNRKFKILVPPVLKEWKNTGN
jgi:hypothetical protein